MFMNLTATSNLTTVNSPVTAVLTKQSSQSEIKMYFEGVMRLASSNEQFPVNLDEVWPLVYAAKNKAVDALRKNFIQDVDFSVINQKVEQVSGAKYAHTYMLSTSCLEYFIARKVRPVFEVYRQVFHKVAQPKALSSLDMLELAVKAARDNQQEIAEVRQEVRELKAATKTQSDYFTVVGYGSLNGFNVTLSLASRIGQRASRICKDRGIPMDKIPDPRFGQVKMYPKDILQEVFNTSI